MTTEEIKTNLCTYDLRNPNGVISFTLDKEDLKEYGEHKRQDCYCENCFYNRTKLAEQLLKALNIK